MRRPYNPGEVNKIREYEKAPHIVVTHSDCPELYVWNTDTQETATPTSKQEVELPATPTNDYSHDTG